MIFWLVLKLEINYIVIISWRILVSFRGFFEDYIFAWWNTWVSIIPLLLEDTFLLKWQGHNVTYPLFLWPQVNVPKSLSLFNLLGEDVKLTKQVFIKDPPIIVFFFFSALRKRWMMLRHKSWVLFCLPVSTTWPQYVRIRHKICVWAPPRCAWSSLHTYWLGN